MVGRELIFASTIRAQASQIESYNTAVNAFLIKYDALPGDIPEPAASGFGFAPRGQYAGEGDGDGIIEGISSDAAGQNDGQLILGGETGTFWVDLSQAKLIEGQFNTVTPTWGGYIAPQYTGKVMPFAKIGDNNSIHVWSGGWKGYSMGGDGKNYYEIANYTAGETGGISGTGAGYPMTGLSPIQAYAIDSKIDDGLPQSGKVIAVAAYNATVYWAAGNISITGITGQFSWPSGGPSNVNTPATANTCYDNNNVNGAVQKYSFSSIAGNGNYKNCWISIQFQ